MVWGEIIKKITFNIKIFVKKQYQIKWLKKGKKRMHSCCLSLTISANLKLTHEELNSTDHYQGLKRLHLQTPSQKFYFLNQHSRLWCHLHINPRIAPKAIQLYSQCLRRLICHLCCPRTNTEWKKPFLKLTWGWEEGQACSFLNAFEAANVPEMDERECRIQACLLAKDTISAVCSGIDLHLSSSG